MVVGDASSSRSDRRSLFFLRLRFLLLAAALPSGNSHLATKGVIATAFSSSLASNNGVATDLPDNDGSF